MDLKKARDYFEKAAKAVDSKKDPAMWNLLKGLAVLTEELEQMEGGDDGWYPVLSEVQAMRKELRNRG